MNIIVYIYIYIYIRIYIYICIYIICIYIICIYIYMYIYIYLKLVYKPLVSPAIPVVFSPSTSRQEELGLFISRFHAACFYRSACDLPYFVRGVSMAGDVLVICSPNPRKS